jgi:hypothetical protein
MEIPTLAIKQAAEEFGISDKLARAYELIAELEPLANELKEYGFDSPTYIYIAPFGHGTSERGKAYVTRAYSLMLELDAEIKERLARLEADPSSAIPWKEVRREEEESE